MEFIDLKNGKLYIDLIVRWHFKDLFVFHELSVLLSGLFSVSGVLLFYKSVHRLKLSIHFVIVADYLICHSFLIYEVGAI